MELQISNTREELLENTINHFNRGNRGVDDRGKCTYINRRTEGRCAIGRELTEELAIKVTNYSNCSVSSNQVYNKLPERLKEMGDYFLRRIQSLHDNEFNWDVDGLSEIGYSGARDIIKIYNLDLELLKIR